MAIANKPDENIFASNAKRGEMDTFPDVSRGWGISFDQTQGIPPMEWFNYLFNRGDLAIQYLMQRGLPEWSESQTYPENAYVQHNGKSYRALRANQNQRPDTANSQDWKQWGVDFDVLNGYIKNEKKSNAVNSASSDTIATSKAVKTVYDKAAGAEDNANGRVSKSGDTMEGSLFIQGHNNQAHGNGLKLINLGGGVNTASHVDYFNAQNRYAQASVHFVDRGSFAADVVILTTPEGNDFNSDRRKEHTRFAHNGNMWVRNYGWLHEKFATNDYARDIENNANGRVSKEGDVIKWLDVKREHAWLTIRSEAKEMAGTDLVVWNGKHPQVSYVAVDQGGFAVAAEIWTTPPGQNYEENRREVHTKFNPDGSIWNKNYGWLHDKFLQRSDCIRTWYPNHYRGAEVYKVRHLGLMIIIMDVGTGNQGSYNLPESFDGFAIPMVTDNGGARGVGVRMDGNNKVYIFGGNTISRSVMVVGFKNV